MSPYQQGLCSRKVCSCNIRRSRNQSVGNRGFGKQVSLMMGSTATAVSTYNQLETPTPALDGIHALHKYHPPPPLELKEINPPYGTPQAAFIQESYE
jgi:hypothetical protein